MVRAATPARQWPPLALTGARNSYDGSLAYLDARVSELFAALKQRGLTENTLVVVASDHGEEFGEHGVYFHGNSLYRASLQVPLMLVLPGRVPAGVVIADPVSLRDLAATIVNLATPEEASVFPGKSLARFWETNTAAEPADSLLSELNYTARLPANTPITRGPMRSIILGQSRLIRNGDGVNELFDVDQDTLEARNLAQDPAAAGRLVALQRALAVLLNSTAP